MDTLTHALAGAAVADGWFRRRLGPAAVPFALAAAALPDADILTFLIAPESVWTHHRGYTHSFLPMLAAAPVIGYIGYRAAKGAGQWALWTLLAVICLFSHTLLDLVTSWGTMPWLPFSNARVSWDIAPILDVFVFSVTAASFAANRILRREKRDEFLNPLASPVVHIHPRRRLAADWVGKTAVFLAVVYLGIGWLHNRQAVREAREDLARSGVAVQEVRALPIMFTYLAYDIAARDEEGVIYSAVYSSRVPRPLRFTAHRSDEGEAVRQALASAPGRMFSWYSQNIYTVRAEPAAEGETRIRLRDRRFSGLTNPDAARFVMDITMSPSGLVLSSAARQLGLGDTTIGAEFDALLRLTLNGELPAASEK